MEYRGSKSDFYLQSSPVGPRVPPPPWGGEHQKKTKFKRPPEGAASPSVTLKSVNEQRVDGSRCVNLTHLRCILLGFERNFRIKIPSNQIQPRRQYYITILLYYFTIAGYTLYLSAIDTGIGIYNGLLLFADINLTALLPLTKGSSSPGDYVPAKVYSNFNTYNALPLHLVTAMRLADNLKYY